MTRVSLLCLFSSGVAASLVSSCEKSDVVERTSLREDEEEVDLSSWVRTPPAPVPISQSDERLAAVQRTCQRCHVLGEASQLTKKLWVNSILPEMGCYLGLHREIPQYERFLEVGRNEVEQGEIDQARLYPEQVVIEREDWDKIVSYYLREAPEDAPKSTNVLPPPLSSGLFKPIWVQPQSVDPSFVHVKVLPEKGGFMAASADAKLLSFFSAEGEILEERDGLGKVVDSDLDRGSLIDIGTLEPNDDLTGRIFRQGEQIPIRLLKRPVSHVWHDFDGDGRDEFVVCEYGNKTGQLTLFSQTQDGEWKETVLDRKSGNRIVRAEDMNGDRRKDLIVLRAQESEDVSIFYHRRSLEFLRSTPLKFPSYWGSNHIELADFDRDGLLDVVLSNGDNGDSSNILKNFHGVRVYRNDGTGGFEEEFEFVLHGAYGASVADYDRDGRLDLAVFSAFPDFESRQPSFYILKGGVDWNFQIGSLQESSQSRWICMDSGDIDGDGDEDIVMGAYLPGPSSVPSDFLGEARQAQGTLLILQNQTVKK